MDGLDHGFGFGPGSTAPALWGELARAAGAGEEAGGAAVARALDPAAAATLARVVAGILDRVGVEPSASNLVPRVDELLRTVEGDLLSASLRQLDPLERRRLAEDACDRLSTAALVALLLAAAPTYRHTISQPFNELVHKLARETAELAEPLRVKAEAAFRSLVRHVFGRWSASQVSAGSGGFEALFQQPAGTAAQSTIMPEPQRVLQLALETGALGPIVWTALRAQTESEAGMRELLDMLKQAPPGHAVDTIAEQISTPARLTAVLQEEPIDWQAADTLIAHVGVPAIRPLLDQLVESNLRAARRALMDRLVRFGPEIQPLVLERVDDPRWYVVRNMIALLREAGCSLDKVPLDTFAAHADARVRRETLQLRLDNPELRDRALAEALLDQDKHVLRTALQAARHQLPPTAAAMLAQRVVEPAFPAEFRVMSLYLLGRSGQPAALETLLRFVHGGKTLLGKVKLAPKSPEMLAALSGLARSWPQERRVRELLDLAGRSTDEQIRNALHAVSGGEER